MNLTDKINTEIDYQFKQLGYDFTSFYYNDVLSGVIEEDIILVCDGPCKREFPEIIKKNLKLYRYTKDIFNSVDICEGCYTIDLIKSFYTVIDRINYNIEEKPRIWPCKGCNIKMGGGFKWYYSKNLNSDLCEFCFNNEDLLQKFMICYNNDKNNFKGYCISNRGLHSLFFKFHKIENIKVPENIKVLNKIDFSFVDSIVNIDPKIDNLATWLLIDELHDEKLINVEMYTSLLVNCDSKSNGEVASILSDNHRRVSIDIVYNNIEEYKQEYSNWLKNQLSDNEKEELVKKLDKVPEDNTVEYSKVCNYFSNYVRLSKNLEIYYG